jgi:hypothetical protein
MLTFEKLTSLAPSVRGAAMIPAPPCNAGRGLMREKDTRWTMMTTTETTSMTTGERGVEGEGEVDAE